MATQRQSLDYYLALEFPYTVEPDEGSYFVSFPDLPNCFSQVDDPGEIAAMAAKIRALWIESEYERGAPIPEPANATGYSGKFVVRVPKTLHRDLANAARREGSSLNAYVSYLLTERNAAAQVNARLSSLEPGLQKFG